MTVDVLLDRLDGVRRTGAGRWLAKCSAHEDRRASLAVRALDDGRVLVHCFAGCDAAEVVGAVGLTLSDLFAPDPERHAAKGERRPFPAADVLRAVSFEAVVVAVAASRLGNGHMLTADDRARLLLAAQRIDAALMAAGISP